jgi:hypothetical protein
MPALTRLLHALLPLLPLLVLATVTPSASAQLSVISSGVQQHTALPGTQHQGVITIRNTSAERQEARVYQTDYTFSADDRSAFPAPGTLERSNAGWVSFSPAQLVLPPNSTQTVTWTVTVPASDSVTGSWWSLLMVETVSPGSLNSRQRSAAETPTLSLNVVTRHAIQLATHVGTTGNVMLQFDSVQATGTTDGKRAFRFDINNTGQRAITPAITLELYNAAGDLVARQAVTRGLLYPGTGIRQSFELGDLPTGDYRAVIVGDGGGDEVFAGQYRIRY